MKYQLLDSGLGRKLEQLGEYRLIRPALNAFWRPTLPEAEWQKSDAVFERNSSGSGHWRIRTKLPDRWEIEWGGFKLLVKPTGFGHLGFFAEQYENWDFFCRFITEKLGKDAKTLNLFGYSGVGSMAMASAGAQTCHLDAARGMIEWGRENLSLNPQVPDSIRWITDDVMKFCRREVRRGAKYQGIALDPPSFGRGSSGQVWKIEDDLPKLLELCNQLLDRERPAFVTLSCHSPGFSPMTLERLLLEAFGAGQVVSREMTIPESTGRLLPAGITSTFFS